MRKILVGLMLSLSMLLTACGEFNSINKSSNEVLEALSPYLSEEDQQRAQELALKYDKDISIRENLLDKEVVEIEIEGHVLQLQILNEGEIAFRINGKNVYFDELRNNSLLESIVTSSLVKVSSNSNALSLVGAQQAQAFIGPLLSSVFGIVVKGIFNYAMVKVTEKVGPVIGGAVGTIGNSVVGGVTGEGKPSNEAVSDAKNTILNAILGIVINRLSGGNVTTPVTGTPNNPVTNPLFPPQQDCNLFCSLFGLLVTNITK